MSVCLSAVGKPFLTNKTNLPWAILSFKNAKKSFLCRCCCSNSQRVNVFLLSLASFYIRISLSLSWNVLLKHLAYQKASWFLSTKHRKALNDFLCVCARTTICCKPVRHRQLFAVNLIDCIYPLKELYLWRDSVPSDINPRHVATFV